MNDLAHSPTRHGLFFDRHDPACKFVMVRLDRAIALSIVLMPMARSSRAMTK
jgi:hypothetical protein